MTEAVPDQKNLSGRRDTGEREKRERERKREGREREREKERLLTGKEIGFVD